MVSKTLKSFPFPRLENPVEVETIAEGNFLSKNKIIWDTKSVSRTEVYIVELFNFHFIFVTLIYGQKVAMLISNILALNVFLRIWTYKMMWE